MGKFAELGIIIAAVSAVAVADVLIKKAAIGAVSFPAAARHPLMWAVVGLYLLQIVLFTFVFAKKAQLGIVGITQTALYAVIVIGSGILFFHERFTALQGAGMALAVIGVILMRL